MIEGVIIKKLEKYSDERGWLAEFFRNDEMNFCPAMGYISVTESGVARGPHEHEKQTDFFIFPGPGDFNLYLWDNRDGSKTKGEHMNIQVGKNNPTFVLVPPGVVHGYKCVSTVEGFCVNLPDKLYKGEGKKEEVDEIRWEKNPNSPYKIS